MNTCAPNFVASKYINQLIISIKKLIDNNTIVVGDFNTPLTSMDRFCKQKIKKEIVILDDTLDMIDLTDVFRILYINRAEYTFFSSAHGHSLD